VVGIFSASQFKIEELTYWTSVSPKAFNERRLARHPRWFREAATPTACVPHFAASSNSIPAMAETKTAAAPKAPRPVNSFSAYQNLM